MVLVFISVLSLGDLKLVERPGAVTIGPHDFVNIKASIKVSSTENGIIFGNIGKRLQCVKLKSLALIMIGRHGQ